MKILITGGAGYIGSHTCKYLKQAGHEVVVFDNLSAGHRDFLRYGLFEYGDVRDPRRLSDVLGKHQPDGVIHFASSIEVGESVTAPGKYYDNNVTGTLNLLRCMVRAGVNKIVMSGTCAVYGLPGQVPIAETCPLAPINPYAFSKMFMERMLEDFRVAHGLSWASLRYFNASGADPEAEIGERHLPESHLIPNVILAALGKAASLRLFGNDYPTPDGTCIRDYIHVQDLASAHLAALERLKPRNEAMIVNLGTGQGYSNLEIIKTVEEITGRTVPVTMAPRRPGDAVELVADSTLARRLLDWRPIHSSLTNIIETAWRWHLADL